MTGMTGQELGSLGKPTRFGWLAAEGTPPTLSSLACLVDGHVYVLRFASTEGQWYKASPGTSRRYQLERPRP